MFESCFTQEEARAEYHRLAKTLHPDIGGNNAEMAAINVAYSEFKPRNRRQPTSAWKQNGDAWVNYCSPSLFEQAADARRNMQKTNKQAARSATSSTSSQAHDDRMTTFEARHWQDGIGQCGG